MKLMAFLLLTGALTITGWMFGSSNIISHMGGIFNSNGSLIDLVDSNNKCNANIIPTNSSDPIDILPNCRDNTSVIGAMILGLIAFGFILILAGFSTMYIIPIILIVALLGFEIFFMPIGYLMDSSISSFIRVPFMIIWNILGISVILEFTLGR